MEAIQTPRTVAEFAREARISKSRLYELPPNLRPRSVRVGKRVVVTEQPIAWLERYAREAGGEGAAQS